MILIGQFDSPFVRRTAISLRLYGHAFEHRPWSVWRDAEKIAPCNPLRRVPVLILDDGEVLVESAAILEYLDEIAGGAALLPRSGAARRSGLQACALACGAAEKAVSLYYEKVIREEPLRSRTWMDRCAAQITDTLDRLEAQCPPHGWWLGGAMSHADIALACALRFVMEGHPGEFDQPARPRIAAIAARCEALQVFQEIQQPLIVTLK